MKTHVYDTEGTTMTKRPQGEIKSGSSKPNLNKEEMAKKMQAADTPGPAHQVLRNFEGDWNAAVTCWMDAGGQPNVSTATSKVKWILDGRFLEEEFHGEMMGTSFTGRCLMGFDNTRQKFKSVWVDSLHTSMCTSVGKADNGYKVITLEGKVDCPGTGRKDVPIKQVFRVFSRDKHVLEMFTDGAKTMVIAYTRR